MPTVRRILRRVELDGVGRRAEKYITDAEIQLKVDNDETLVPHIVAKLLEHIRALGGWCERDLLHIGTALDESLMNAIVHGNLEYRPIYVTLSAAERIAV